MKEFESSESDEGESDDEEEEYTPKKRKTVQSKTPNKGRGKKGKEIGKLEVLKTLPVEILIEVRSLSRPPPYLAFIFFYPDRSFPTSTRTTFSPSPSSAKPTAPFSSLPPHPLSGREPVKL